MTDTQSPAIQSVCVYCGSSALVDDVFKDAARETGRRLGEAGMTLVYGGGHTGLMGMTADAALVAGGKAIGIIPDFIKQREVMHEGLTELHVVDSMHERKMMMAERSDAFIVLPGGFGTLEEFFEILTWHQLGLHKKPIILVDIAGYWTGLVHVIESMINEGFARPENRDCFMVANSVEDAIALLKTASVAAEKSDMMAVEKI